MFGLNKRHRRILKAELLRRQGNSCHHCGGKMRLEETLSDHPDFATFDHVKPLSKGGHPTNKDNVVLAHQRCNQERGDQPMPGVNTFGQVEESRRMSYFE